MIRIFGFLLLLSLYACKHNEPFSTQGDLTFSRDTVHIDTLFTTVKSPTARLTVKNHSGKNLEIKKISLLSGTQSEFSFIFDGVAGPEIDNFILDKGDSVIVFISLKSNEKEKQVQDKIYFQIGDKVQEVVLTAFVRDAYFIEGIDSTTLLPCNQIFTNDKPWIIDGVAVVAQGCTLTIMPGTEIRFSSWKYDGIPSSQLLINGTLICGDSLIGDSVLISSWRLDDNYNDSPGQWHGIRFLKESKSSKIMNTNIKNASIGIEVDSISINSEPKLLLNGVKVANMSNFGILGLGAAPANGSSLGIFAKNVLVTNCGQSGIGLFFGGSYVFTNTTIANLTYTFRRQQPSLAISDYLKINDNQVNTYPLSAQFINCIVWGTEEQEWGSDFATTNALLTFDHCLLRSKSDVTIPGNDNLTNQDPQFENVENRIFKIKTSSPAKDAGISIVGLTPTFDLSGKLRSGNPDIGAYEAD